MTFSDTAGLRESDDAIEAEGVRRALARAEDAHLVIHVVRDGSETHLSPDIIYVNTEDDVSEQSGNEVTGNALSGLGVDILLSEIERHILQKFSGLENAALTRIRHVDCISSAAQNVDLARRNLGVEPELASEDLRKSLKYIEELAGRSDMEQVFDRIFSSFCIGK